MEKLFVYAILYSVGYDVWEKYEVLSLMQEQPINRDIFGKELMAKSPFLYSTMRMTVFLMVMRNNVEIYTNLR